MKKVLFLLLVTSMSYGQALFDKGIKVTTNINDTTATKVVVKSANNVYNYQDIVKFQKEKGFLSTGLIKNGLISINGDPTKFNITAGVGIISNFDNPDAPTSTVVPFGPFNGITPTYLNTGNATYVAINSTPAVVMQATPFTAEQRRSLIVLGAVIHSNLTTINVLNNISAPTNADTNQLHDFMEAIGALNLTGNKYTENGANLQLNKSAGVLFKLGSNFAVDWRNPHQISQAGGTAITFRYRTQNGIESADMTSISPSLYDLNNVLTTVPNNKFTIQTVTVFQTGLTRIQWGQSLYDDLQSAKNALLTRNFVVENNIKENGVTRAYIIVRNSTTSLQNVADAYISEAQKFGGVASGGVALTLANIVTALGYTPENVANKQNSLAVDGTGVKYPTVDATNAGLALKANIDNPTFTGVLTNTNNIVSNNTDGVPSRFGGTSTSFSPSNSLDILSSVNTNFLSGDGHYRAISAVGIFSGTSSSTGTITGISGRGTTDLASTGDLTMATFGGGFKGGRFRAAHRGSGTITKTSGVSADVENTGGFILNSVAFNAEPTYVALSKTTTSHSAFLAEGGSVLGTLTNNHGLYINPLIAGVNRWGVYQAGSTDKNYFAGNTLFGTTTDNNQGVAQFNGNITISDGTLANHAVTKGQLDLKQNTLTNPITGTGTTNTLPKFTGTSSLGNSLFSDNGTNGAFGASNYINKFSIYGNANEYTLRVGQNTSNFGDSYTGIQFVNSTNLSGVANSIIKASRKATGLGAELQFILASTPILTLATSGNSLFGTIADNGQGIGQFEGNVTAFPATLSNQVVVKSQLDLKADLASPTFTGVPSVPTATVGTNTTQIASTAFVLANSMSLSGNQSFSGQKTFNNGLNPSIRIDNTTTNLDGALQVVVSDSGRGANFLNSSTGTANYIQNLGTGIGQDGINLSTGVLHNFTSTSTSTGDLLRVNKDGIGLVSKINHLGEYTIPKLTMTGTIELKSYTVATLPTGVQGATAYVTDALSPTYLGIVVGGGAVVAPVFYNGTNWVTH